MASDGEARATVGFVQKQFACPDCGFELLGQRIIQLGQGLLVTRCPECGRQIGHPLALLSRRQLRRQLSALVLGWWTAVAIGILASSAFLGAQCGWLGVELTRPFARRLNQLWIESHFVEGRRPGHVDTPQAGLFVDPAWWARQDPRWAFKEAGGWRGLDWTAVGGARFGLMFGFVAVVAIVIGLPRVRGWRQVALGLLVIGGPAVGGLWVHWRPVQ